MSKTSVIIPTHNRPERLPRAVESARMAGRDVEVIVVDDASTDQTAQVCRSLNGIKYVRVDRNQGVAGARNIGLMHSEAEYVTFLDDDDLRIPGSIDLQIRALSEKTKAGFACGGMIIVDQDYQPTGAVTHPGYPSGDVFWHLLEFDFPAMGLSTLIRKECFLRAGLYRKRLDGIDDWDMLVRLAEIYQAVVIPEPMGIYRQPTAQSGQGSSSYAALLYRVAQHQKQLFKLPRVTGAPNKTKRAVRRGTLNRISDTLLARAAFLMARGELGLAAENIKVALRLRPSRACRPQSYLKLAQLWLTRPHMLYSS
ncbi:MAG TPA: glycosyltransferase family 2 protein [Pyrinomonadaceae bacterium]